MTYLGAAVGLPKDYMLDRSMFSSLVGQLGKLWGLLNAEISHPPSRLSVVFWS